MDESDFRPPDDIMDSDDKPATLLGKRKTSNTNSGEKNHLLGPICPICAKVLGPSTSNQGLNDHVDWCLNKDAITEAGKRTPKKAKGSGGSDTAKRKGVVSARDVSRKAENKSSMMGWLKKEV